MDNVIRERLEFLNLDDSARARLHALGPLFNLALPLALDELYRRIRASKTASAFFRSASAMSHARSAQAAHWRALVSGEFGDTYALGARATGEAHARIGLEPRWYLGGYAVIMAEMVGTMVKSRWPSTSSDRAEAEQLGADAAALIKAAILDADLGVSFYIEAAQRAERVLAHRLQMSLDAARAGVIEVDFALEQAWCSPEINARLGRQITFHELVEDPSTFCHPADLESFTRRIRTWGRRDKEPFEFRVRLPSGRYRWVQLLGELELDGQGRRARLLTLVTDVHARKRQELALIKAQRDAQDATEAKSRFLANMSHEIRTPMNGILGVLSLLEREPLSEDGRRLLAEARDCGGMLSQLLNDILDASKIEAGKLDNNPEPLDAVHVLRGVVDMLRPQAAAKGVSLDVKAHVAEEWVMADPVRLRQMLFNLVGNAVKFTSDGRVEARIGIRDEGCDAGRLVFEIEDTGIGIPYEAQKTLFQPFRQGGGDIALRFGGTGLGLNITRSIARLMGGDVGFTSRVGIGSTFWIDLPAVAAMRQSHQSDTFVSLPLQGLDVLVVDDNPTNRLVATRMLEALGATVEAAEDGLFALEALRSRSFDAICMDIEMPRMDGLEATRRIRALPGPESAILIIGLTANAQAEAWARYRAVGMDAVVGKPISIGALVAELAKARATAPAETTAAKQPGWT